MRVETLDRLLYYPPSFTHLSVMITTGPDFLGSHVNWRVKRHMWLSFVYKKIPSLVVSFFGKNSREAVVSAVCPIASG